MHNKKQKVIMTVSNDLVADNRVHKIASTLVDENFEVEVIGRKLKNSLELPENSYRKKFFNLCFTQGSFF